MPDADPGRTPGHADLPELATWSPRRLPPATVVRILMILGAGLLGLSLLGYHPYAEDGGIYTAAVEVRLHSQLFSHDRVWVTAHTRFAVFVPLVAVIVHTLHLSTATALLLLHAAGFIALLTAAAHLAQSCLPQQRRPWLALLTVAVAAGLPVAGTGLYAVDPYCTARSLTTPLLLFALSFALRRHWTATAACWIAAATLHPLMAIWGSLPLLVLVCLFARHSRGWLLALAAATVLAVALLLAVSPPETAVTRQIAHTRAYWFPAQWRWYEWAGAIAPCVLLGVAARSSGQPATSPLHRLAVAATIASAFAAALAFAFARETATSLAVARLQPLRAFHLIFLAFLAAAAAFVQSRLRTRARALLAVIACAALATATCAMQRSLYAHTNHLEWPGAPPSNPWEAAFIWCRAHTPPSALFALDSRYIDEPTEDSHGFRAVALRSALPDGVKDAGIAAVLPNLTASWQTGTRAITGLNAMPDTERRTRLLPLGVSWIVLPRSASTALPCPFTNVAVQVCQLAGGTSR